MSDFPSLPHYAESRRIVDDGIDSELATDGTIRARAMFSAPVFTFDLRLRLDATDYATLITHYGSNKTGTFSYTWATSSQTDAYTVQYLGRPVDASEQPGGNVTAVEVRLQGTET